MSINTAATVALSSPGFTKRNLIQVEGTTLHWAEMGAGRPCILLHGLNDSGRTWQQIAPALAQTRQVLMPDLPGHGLSGRSDASYSLAWHAQVISGWIDALGIDEFDLVGHSFGGGVAQWLLLERFKQVRRLGLIAAGGLGREVTLGLRLASLPYILESFGQPLMSLGTHLGMKAAGGLYSNEELAQLKWMNAQPGTARALGRTVRDVINWQGQYKQFLDRAHEFTDLPPTALFWGDRDKVIPFSHALEMEALIEGTSITRFAGVGHFPHHERPQQLVAALTTFLDDKHISRARMRSYPAPPPPEPTSRKYYAWNLVKRGFGLLGNAWRIATESLSSAWQVITQGINWAWRSILPANSLYAP